jgi:hypothetical protein
VLSFEVESTLPFELENAVMDHRVLREAVVREGWPTRAAAADMLRDLGDKGRPASAALRKSLLAAVAAKDWGDVDLLLDALLEIDAPAAKPAAPELAKLLDASDELTVRLGFHALALMGARGAEAVPALVRCLESED